MKTNFRLLRCALLILATAAPAWAAKDFFDKILPPYAKPAENQVSGIFYCSDVNGTVEVHDENGRVNDRERIHLFEPPSESVWMVG